MSRPVEEFGFGLASPAEQHQESQESGDVFEGDPYSWL